MVAELSWWQPSLHHQIPATLFTDGFKSTDYQTHRQMIYICDFIQGCWRFSIKKVFPSITIIMLKYSLDQQGRVRASPFLLPRVRRDRLLPLTLQLSAVLFFTCPCERRAVRCLTFHSSAVMAPCRDDEGSALVPRAPSGLEGTIGVRFLPSFPAPRGTTCTSLVQTWALLSP